MLVHALPLLTSVLVLAGAASAAPNPARRSFGVPHDDGFPTPNSQQLLDIEKVAGGTLSNAPPPAKLAQSTLTAFQLIAFNELFEVAFFKSLIDNVTANTAGYELPSQGKKYELLGILESVLAVSSRLSLYTRYKARSWN